MTWIIIGMTIGITFILLLVFNMSYFWWSNKNDLSNIYKKSTKSLKNFNNALMSLKKWANLNNFSFIGPTLFKYGSNNKMFAIDALVLTHFGIVVVKIKTINGEILGSAKKDYLIKEVLGKKNKILNFIKKNDDSLLNLIKMTKLKVPIISLLIFFNESYKLKINHKPDHVVIAKSKELIDILSKMNNSITHTLTSKKIKKIKKTILFFKTISKKDKISYKEEYLNSILYEKKKN